MIGLQRGVCLSSVCWFRIQFRHIRIFFSNLVYDGVVVDVNVNVVPDDVVLEGVVSFNVGNPR